MKLKDKTAVIMGGSGGIGRVISEAFLKEGAKIVIASNNDEELKKAFDELKSIGERNIKYVRMDISNLKEVEDLIKQTISTYDTIDILINAAAIQSPIGPFAEISFDSSIKNLEVNLIGTMSTCKSVLPIMIQNRKGKIINFSGGGSFAPRPNFSIYAAAKTAVVRFSETLAEEVKEFGIDVNVIAPGSVDTGMVTEILNAGNKAGEVAIKEATRVRTTGGTGADPAAMLAVFLASDESKGITGKVISAAWDNWKNFPNRIEELNKSSLYTIRRIDGKFFFEKND